MAQNQTFPKRMGKFFLFYSLSLATKPLDSSHLWFVENFVLSQFVASPLFWEKIMFLFKITALITINFNMIIIETFSWPGFFGLKITCVCSQKFKLINCNVTFVIIASHGKSQNLWIVQKNLYGKSNPNSFIVWLLTWHTKSKMI